MKHREFGRKGGSGLEKKGGGKPKNGPQLYNRGKIRF